MKKFFALALSLALALTAFAGCSGTSASTSMPSAASGSTTGSTELNLYTWEGMFPQEVLDAFTAETGIKVNYSSFDTDENMLMKLEAANGGDYDVVIADDYILEPVIAQGLAQKLDKTLLTNYGNINPLYQGQFYDPEDEYTVPYGAGVMSIIYDPSAVDMEITSYADLWDPSLKDNLGLIANSRVVTGMALKMMGESYNTEDLDIIQRAIRCWSLPQMCVLSTTTTCRTLLSPVRWARRSSIPHRPHRLCRPTRISNRCSLPRASASVLCRNSFPRTRRIRMPLTPLLIISCVLRLPNSALTCWVIIAPTRLRMNCWMNPSANM